MTRITPADLRRWGACYDDAWIAEQYRRRRWSVSEGVSPVQIARAWRLTVEDRLWVMLRPEVLGERGCLQVSYACVDRAVLHAATAMESAGLTDEGRALRALHPAATDTLAAIGSAAMAAARAARDAGDAWAAAWAAARAAWAARAAGDAWAARAAARAAGDARAAERRWQLRLVTRMLGGDRG